MRRQEKQAFRGDQIVLYQGTLVRVARPNEIGEERPGKVLIAICFGGWTKFRFVSPEEIESMGKYERPATADVILPRGYHPN